MDLILWRHADAEMLQPGQDDLDRVLTPKGERQAQRMARWLNKRLAESTRILVTPARRSQQTAEALNRDVTVVSSIAPGSSVEDLLAAAGWPGASGTVLIVGHQPTLGMAAARLLAGTDMPWTIKKAAIWWLHRRERDGEVRVSLHAVQSVEAL